MLPFVSKMLPLSPREAEVLRLYDEGLEMKEIGEALQISVHTVFTYAKRILEKSHINGKPCSSLRRAAWLRRGAVEAEKYGNSDGNSGFESKTATVENP